jgi:hypothetical protein
MMFDRKASRNTKMPKHGPPTVESLKTGLANIDRSLSQLKHEMNTVGSKLGKFKDQGARGYSWNYIPPEWMGENKSWRVRSETDEPKNNIGEALRAGIDNDSVIAANLIIRAIAKDIDGALRDIRALRADIEAIKDDSDLRGDFKDWLSRNR